MMRTTANDHIFPTCAICGETGVEDAGDHANQSGHWPAALPDAPRGAGQTIAAIRTGLGLTRTDLAARLDVSLDSVKSWEHNRRPIPAGIWDELQALEDLQEQEINRYIEAFTNRPQDPAVLCIETGPYAKAVGWRRVVAARVRRTVPRVDIVSPSFEE